MKKYLYSFATAMLMGFGFAMPAMAQKHYTVSTHHARKPLDDQAKSLVTNTSSNPITINWIMLSNNANLLGWSYDFCDLNTCFASSQSIPSSGADVLDAGAASNLNFYLESPNGNNTSTGIITVRLFEKNMESEADTVILELNPAASIEEYASMAKAIGVYPNPAANMLSLDLSKTGFKPVTISITNMLGQTISLSKELISANHIDISSLPVGMYVLKMTDEQGAVVSKPFEKVN